MCKMVKKKSKNGKIGKFKLEGLIRGQSIFGVH